LAENAETAEKSQKDGARSTRCLDATNREQFHATLLLCPASAISAFSARDSIPKWAEDVESGLLAKTSALQRITVRTRLARDFPRTAMCGSEEPHTHNSCARLQMGPRVRKGDESWRGAFS